MEPLLTQDPLFLPNTGLLDEAERPIGEIMSEGLLGGQIEEINKTGDYRGVLPEHETQYGAYYDTMTCTNFAALNGIEILEIYKYGEEHNWSDRFNAKMSGTSPDFGNYASAALNSVKKHGLVHEARWTWDRGADVPQEQKYVTWFYSNIPQEIKDEALKWGDEREFDWGWVAMSAKVSRKTVREALKISPVGISIPQAESIDDNGVYHSSKTVLGHRVNVIYVYDDDRVEVIDHYMRTRILGADYQIGWPTYSILNKKDMQSKYVKVLKDKNGKAVGVLTIGRNEEGFKNVFESHGISYKEKEGGGIDWSSVNIQGNYELL